MSTAWIGLIGALLGSAVSGYLTFLVAGMRLDRQRDDSIRSERLTRYTTLLDSGEAAVHRFERIAEGMGDPDSQRSDAQLAIDLYDVELTRSLQLLRLSAPPVVEEAATRYRRQVGTIRRMFIAAVRVGSQASEMPKASSTDFQTALNNYRRARREFIELARVDLEFDALADEEPN